MKKIIGKYIGPKKIKKVKLAERKTYLGKDVYEITYEDNTTEEYSEENLNTIVSDKEKDLTSLREVFVKPIVEKLIVILLEAEVKIMDVEYILNLTANSLNENIETAITKIIGKDKYNRTLADIHKILIQKNGE